MGNDRYAVHSYHSDYWWDVEFISMIADEMDERVAMIPEMYPSFQYLPLGSSSQWARNADKNALSWRDARPYVDDWMFTKNALPRCNGFAYSQHCAPIFPKYHSVSSVAVV